MAMQDSLLGCAESMQERRFLMQFLAFFLITLFSADLKSANLLLDDVGGVRIADFGLSRMYADVQALTGAHPVIMCLLVMIRLHVTCRHFPKLVLAGTLCL